MKKISLMVLSTATFLFFSCTNDPIGNTGGNGGDRDQNQPFAVVKSVSVSRENSAASQDMLTGQARSNNTFAVKLYQLLLEEEKNLFFSPYSITAALAMTAAGGVGDTKQQIRDALQVTLEGDIFDQAINGIDRSLMEHADVTEGITINIVNSTWMQSGWDFKISYLDHLSRYYGAGVNLLDFVNEPDESRIVINTWVADNTNQKIEDLLPQGVITPATVLVLTNAIYFLADWLLSFNVELTAQKSFTLLDNSVVQTPLMQLVESGKKVKMLYTRGSGVRALDFPYKGDRLAMTVLLPDAGAFSAFESSLNTAIIDQLIAALDSTELAVSLPKFKFTSSSISLVDALEALGMIDAFSPGVADFSGIDGSRSLYVSEVLHKAFISVDEKGTEAAAATAVIFSNTSVNPNEVIFVVNRPFIFVIRDKATGTILFMGRIVDPTVF